MFCDDGDDDDRRNGENADKNSPHSLGGSLDCAQQAGPELWSDYWQLAVQRDRWENVDTRWGEDVELYDALHPGDETIGRIGVLLLLTQIGRLCGGTQGNLRDCELG